MNARSLLLTLTLCVAPLVHAQSPSRMSHRATGTFDVKTIPQPADDPAGGGFGRLFLDKKFHGALDATSTGTMLGYQAPDKSGAGYVAMELVKGTLDGRTGTFALQHTGTMQGSEMSLVITVVPGSGTDQLKGLAGTFKIIIEGKQHSYDFDYTLPDAAR